MADHKITLTTEQEDLLTKETNKKVEDFILDVVTQTVNSIKNRDVRSEFDQLSYDDKRKALDSLKK